MILSILRRRRINPSTEITDAAVLLRWHTQSPKRATNTTLKPNFMMIPEVREFCFNIFLSEFFMRYDIFFASSVGSVVLCFKGNNRYRHFRETYFFRINTLAAGKRKICFENRKAQNMNSKIRTYLCPLN